MSDQRARSLERYALASGDPQSEAAEEWRDIPGYGGVYQASSLGRVRSTVGRWSPRLRVLSEAMGGARRNRPQVKMTLSGRARREYVSKLVLLAFVGPAPAGTECCHFNDMPADNRLENLRWDTRAANRADQIRNERQPSGERHWCSKLTSAAVHAIRSRPDSTSSLAREFGVSPTTVSRVRCGRTWRGEAK